jgi:hypothetical protein
MQKKLLKKNMGKGHTCLRKHDEKDEKKKKEEGSEVLAEEESRNDVDQFCRNVKSFKNRPAHFRATLGAYLS